MRRSESTRTVLLTASLLAAALSAVPTPGCVPADACLRHTDCDDGLSCRQGRCVADDGAGGMGGMGGMSDGGTGGDASGGAGGTSEGGMGGANVGVAGGAPG